MAGRSAGGVTQLMEYWTWKRLSYPQARAPYLQQPRHPGVVKVVKEAVGVDEHAHHAPGQK